MLTLAGAIWTGRQAKDAGLVDALGTLDDAIAEAKSMAKLPAGEDVEYLILPEPGNLLESLLGGKLGLSARGGDLLSLLKTLPEAKTHLRAAENLLRMRGDRAWLVLPYSMRLR